MDCHTCNISHNGREKLLTFPPIPLRFFHPPAIPSLLPCSPNLSLSLPLSLSLSHSLPFAKSAAKPELAESFKEALFWGMPP